MNILVSQSSAQFNGIALNVFTQSQLATWLTTQDDFIQNYVNNSALEKTKHLVIACQKTGKPQQVIALVEQQNDMWSIGDLAAKLPAGVYQIQGDAAAQKQVALGFVLGAYQFAGYKSLTESHVRLAISDEALFAELTRLVEATYLVRDLVNTPAGDMMPQHLAQVMRDLAATHQGQFSQWVGDELLEQNYPTIHLVGRASENKPRLLDLRWGAQNAPKVTLVGKGVCFDSGGLDLKPASGMRLMKKDMGGAAHVIGLAHLIMAANLPVQLRVLVPAVENAVSRNAFRPGDVVKTRKGITVEIDNTDAEGRLVLCDALDEAQQDNPDIIIDFATLTGACRVALGTELPGFFTNDNAIAQQLVNAGEQSQDPVWQLPLFTQYKSLLKSEVADISNCASVPFGGAITAALYLQEFVAPDTPWVHFDIMAWNSRAQAGRPVGGEAFGIRAVFTMLAQKYMH